LFRFDPKGRGLDEHCPIEPQLLLFPARASRASVRQAALAIPQRLLEHTFHRVRRNSKFCKSGPPRRTHVIDLHQLHLIAGDGRIQEQFCSPCQCPPSGEREWNVPVCATIPLKRSRAGMAPIRLLRNSVAFRHLTFCANSREFKSPAPPCGNVELGIIEQGEVDPGSDFARGRLLEDEIGRSLPALAQLALLRESPNVGSGRADRAERAAIFGGEGSGELLGQIRTRQHAGKIGAGPAQCESAVSPGELPRPRRLRRSRRRGASHHGGLLAS